MPSAALERSPIEYWRKKRTGSAISRSQTPDWAVRSTRPSIRSAARFWIIESTAAAAAATSRITTYWSIVALAARGTRLPRILPVMIGVRSPSTATMIPVAASVANSVRSPLAPNLTRSSPLIERSGSGV